MKKQLKEKTNKVAYILLILTLLSSLILGIKVMHAKSFGSDVEELKVQANLEKYINYELEGSKEKGTLVQYNIKGEIEKENNYIPIKNSEIVVNLSQIDGKYPYKVKAIARSSEITNGKTNGIEENYEYDANSGKVIIKASNQNEQGEIVYKDEPSEEAKDEYVIICYYDTYKKEEVERDLKVEISAKAELASENSITIDAQNTFEAKVAKNEGTLTSINQNVEDIYNGYIKSNKINGTNYNTKYKEESEIVISKKEAQEKIEIEQSSNVVYKSIKIAKENLIKILGEEGKIEVFDKSENKIGELNKDTQEINYENEQEEIVIKTSNIEQEGILKVEHEKEIKSEMESIESEKIKTIGKIVGIKEEKEIYTNSIENEVEIKDAKTNINVSIDNPEWTNKQQNEITFDIALNAKTIKDNLFKNPSVQIELPEQVEKVIIQNGSIFNGNGLELKDTVVQTNENGNQEIIANLIGEQTAYSENALELSTNVKIAATIILKKDIETAEAKVNITHENQYEPNEIGNQEIPLKIENYKEEQIKPIVQEEKETYYQAEAVETKNEGDNEEENIEGLKLEVAPEKGETDIAKGDVIYEGEYIKYNIKLTNTSEKEMKNVKIVGNIPEGTTYGELEADYETSGGKYQYNFDNSLKIKEIEIETIKAGETVSKYYEVKANDLEENNEKEIISNIKAYVGKTEVATYELTNIVKPAEVKIFLGVTPRKCKRSVGIQTFSRK